MILVIQIKKETGFGRIGNHFKKKQENYISINRIQNVKNYRAISVKLPTSNRRINTEECSIDE